MNLGLEGKVALVTGSSRGIGFAIARTLKNEGCQVVLNGRDEASLAKASQELGGTVSLVADTTVPAECDKLVSEVLKKLGRLDVLVCNVGSGTSVPPGNETAEEWRRVFDLNFFSTTNMVEAARTALAKSNGNVVCVSSICGLEILGAPLTYSSAKAALNHYVRGMARPLGTEGVRINAVAPGNVLFKGSVWEKKTSENAEAVNAMLKRDVALNRLGTPDEIADAVAFLASQRATFITGSLLVADGGQTKS